MKRRLIMLLEAARRAKVNAEPSPSPALSVRLNGALMGSIPDASSGRTSAPRLPQAVQVKPGSISDSRVRSGQRSALTSMWWLHLWSRQ